MPIPCPFRRRPSALLPALALAALGLVSVPATACDAAAVALVVPYPPGGSADAVARVIAQQATQQTGKAFVLQHVPGASGANGARLVARAAADGCTVLVGSPNSVVLAPASQPEAGYAPQDLAPVAKVGSSELLLVASPSLGAVRIEQLGALARRLDHPLRAGHPGVDTLQHLALATIAQRLALPLARVPYRGGGPMLADVVGGHIDLAVVAEPSARPLLDQGRLALVSHLGDWYAQQGLSLQADWSGWFVPRDTPPRPRRWLQQALTDALAQPEVRTALAALGSTPATDAEQRRFAQDVAQDIRRHQRP